MRSWEELEEEVARLQAEKAQLREQLTQALALIAQLQQELEQLRSGLGEPPTFIKPSTPQPRSKADKSPRRKRAKDQNGARKREAPTRTVEHRLQQCPDCAYPLRHPTLSKRRQVNVAR